jgi:hypothetical protein
MPATGSTARSSVGAVGELLSRRRGRRWQRFSEVAPEDDYLRWARVGAVVATTFFVLLFGTLVIGLVFLR